jgi:hypothetical protein
MKAADNAMHTYFYTKPYAALPHVSIESPQREAYNEILHQTKFREKELNI